MTGRAFRMKCWPAFLNPMSPPSRADPAWGWPLCGASLMIMAVTLPYPTGPTAGRWPVYGFLPVESPGRFGKKTGHLSILLYTVLMSIRTLSVVIYEPDRYVPVI